MESKFKSKRKYLFHLTNGKNLNSINADGFIKPKFPFRSYVFPLCFFRPKAVYLTENPLHWCFIQSEYQNTFLLIINIDGLELKKDFQHGVVDYLCENSIPLSRIEKVYNLKEFVIDDKLQIKENGAK